MAKPKYDFGGWATKYNVKCTDGRIIKPEAFLQHDGTRIPLVWNHEHNDLYNYLGYADLEHREGVGMYAHCSFNDTDDGLRARQVVAHGDVVSMSIFANRLKQDGSVVVGGRILEVSLVPAGANPGAYIDSVVMAHSDDCFEGTIYTGEPLELCHSDEEEPPEVDPPKTDPPAEEPDSTPPTNNEEPDLTHSDVERTVGDVVNTMNEEQQAVLFAMVNEAHGKTQEQNQEQEEGEPVKKNVFDKDDTAENTLSHSDQQKIIAAAKTSAVGTLKAAVQMYAAELSHAAGDLDNGFAQISNLFPEYKDVRPGAPEMLTTDQGWIARVLAKVHKSPITRIRTRQADVRDITNLRAKGYVKGTEKTYVGNLKMVSRTTDPQSVYVKSKLDRDDIIDITDFDVVAYMYNVDRMNLNEELATAIMIGDGREDGEEGKIKPEHIRPVWQDDELYTIHKDVDIEAMRAELQGTDTAMYFGDNYVYAEAIIQTLLYAREKYKGSGTPDFYCTPHLLNVMLLARDRDGHRMYSNVNDLKAALNVSDIITAEQFEGKTRVTADNKTKKFLALMYNLSDYALGATKGGEITHFTQFDIDFNQEKSLLETRLSGANTRVLSAIALEEDVTPAEGG